jgi:hypothetical protein
MTFGRFPTVSVSEISGSDITTSKESKTNDPDCYLRLGAVTSATTAGTSSQGNGPTVDSLLSLFACPMPRCLKQCQQRFIHEPRCPAACKRATGHGGHCDCLQKHIPIQPRSSSSVLKNYDWSASGLLNVLEFLGPNDEVTCIPCGPPQELNWPELLSCRRNRHMPVPHRRSFPLLCSVRTKRQLCVWLRIM